MDFYESVTDRWQRYRVCVRDKWLTTQDFDAGCMQVVLRSNEWAHSYNKEIPKAGDEGHNPHGHPQDQAG